MGPEMGDAQVRCDERFEADDLKRCVQFAEGSPHQPEMNAADDELVFPRENPERAMSKPDRFVGPGGHLWREAGVVEERDDPVNGGGCAGSRGRLPRLRGQRSTPTFAGRHRGRCCPGLPGQTIGEDLGELAVGGRIRLSVFRQGDVAKARSSTARGCGSAADDEPRIDELVELLTNGVRVESDGLGKLAHAGRNVSLAQDREEARAGQPGKNTVAALRRCHDLHFARIWV